MFHVIDTNIANSCIMYKVHMTWFGKLAKTMSHLKCNVALTRALIKKGAHFIPKATTMVGAFVPNLGGLDYSMQWTRTSTRRRLPCV
jgi:hypothetical protein